MKLGLDPRTIADRVMPPDRPESGSTMSLRDSQTAKLKARAKYDVIGDR